MDFIYKQDGNNRIIGVKFSVKFGKGSEKEDKARKAITSLVSVLKNLGVAVTEDDTSVYKDKKLV